MWRWWHTDVEFTMCLLSYRKGAKRGDTKIINFEFKLLSYVHKFSWYKTRTEFKYENVNENYYLFLIVLITDEYIELMLLRSFLKLIAFSPFIQMWAASRVSLLFKLLSCPIMVVFSKLKKWPVLWWWCTSAVFSGLLCEFLISYLCSCIRFAMCLLVYIGQILYYMFITCVARDGVDRILFLIFTDLIF